MRRACSSRPSFSITSSVVRPATDTSGPPPNVVPWLPGLNTFAATPLPRHAPIGTPEAKPLASVITSGVIPDHWCANHLPVRPKLAQVVRVGHVNAALALQHLHQDGDDRLVLGDALDRGVVVVRHAQEPAHQRLEPRLRLARAGGRESGESAAVPGLFHHDDGGVLDAAVMPVQARDLDRALVGLRTRVGEERVVHPGERADLFREPLLLRHAEEVRGVDELGRLVAQRTHQRRVGVAQPVDRDAREGVQVLLALGIPEPRALAAREGDGLRGVCLHQVAIGHKVPFPKNRSGGLVAAAGSLLAKL